MAKPSSYDTAYRPNYTNVTAGPDPAPAPEPAPDPDPAPAEPEG